MEFLYIDESESMNNITDKEIGSYYADYNDIRNNVDDLYAFSIDEIYKLGD